MAYCDYCYEPCKIQGTHILSNEIVDIRFDLNQGFSLNHKNEGIQQDYCCLYCLEKHNDLKRLLNLFQPMDDVLKELLLQRSIQEHQAKEDEESKTRDMLLSVQKDLYELYYKLHKIWSGELEVADKYKAEDVLNNAIQSLVLKLGYSGEKKMNLMEEQKEKSMQDYMKTPYYLKNGTIDPDIKTLQLENKKLLEKLEKSQNKVLKQEEIIKGLQANLQGELKDHQYYGINCNLM